MSNNLFVGLAVGTVMGMCIAAKNRSVAQKVHKAEEAVKAKICSIGSEICDSMNPENQPDMQAN